LAQYYEIYLGAFVDSPQDWQYVESVKRWCFEFCAINLQKKIAKTRSISGLWCNKPLTLTYYYDQSMHNWVDQVLADHSIKHVLIFSSAMAQYVSGENYLHLRRIIDFVDVDSDKWVQYSRSKTWPMKWVYQREGKVLRRFEQMIANEFDASTFVSPVETALFKRISPNNEAKIICSSNGVDTNFFDPARTYSNPYEANEKVLIFTGAMDYWANIDAANWFAKDIFPIIRQKVKEACFYIVGARPTAKIFKLMEIPGVKVTGAVPEMPPYLAHAQVAVAPLRIARGIQNKVLEAMAMAKPVVLTSAAMDGIEPCQILNSLVSNEANAMDQLIIDLLNEKRNYDYGQFGRNWVLQHYNWNSNLYQIKKLLQNEYF
jgi:sugar transferase (PEP-CTERM/EpsH1 system associated)